MGIRISKNIGYFLTNKQSKQILVKDYPEVIDSFQDIKPEQLKNELLKELENYSSSLQNEYVDKIYLKYVINNAVWDAEELISTSYNYDTPKGILFQTPELHKQRRYDDNIDYYENPDMKYSSNAFFRPIYPLAGYVYLGETIQFLDKTITKGTLISPEYVSPLLRKLQGKTEDKYSSFIKQVKNSKLFTPQTDPLIYLMAKILKIINTDEFTFRTTIQPSIITDWG